MRALATEEAAVHRAFGARLQLEEIQDVHGIGMLMKRMRYSVDAPVAYRIKGTDSVLVFGELKNPMDIELLKRMYEASMQEKSSECEPAGMYRRIDAPVPAADGRLLEEDVALITSQTSLPRDEIVRALVETDYDVVDAMMKLTK